ncbi:AAEL014542-PA, partial [Aedes aegypti]
KQTPSPSVVVVVEKKKECEIFVTLADANETDSDSSLFGCPCGITVLEISGERWNCGDFGWIWCVQAVKSVLFV